MTVDPIGRLRSRANHGFRGYPIGTISFYGPTNEFASKAAVGIIPSEGAETSALERWHSGELDVRHDSSIAKAVIAFLDTHRVRSVVMTRGIIGCPHEEGIDYPVGTPCPACPFWAGRDRWRDA